MTSMQDLPDEIRLQVFNNLTFATRREILPLVCKEWHQFTLRSPSLWEHVALDCEEELDVWRLMERAQGRVPDQVLRTRSPSRILAWFQQHPRVHSVRAFDQWNCFRGSQGSLSVCLAAMKDKLRVLDLDSVSWVGSDLCFAHLGWLSNLRSLSLKLWQEHPAEPLILSPNALKGLSSMIKLEELSLIVPSRAQGKSWIPFPGSFFQLPQLRALQLSAENIGMFHTCAFAVERLSSLLRLEVLDLTNTSMYEGTDRGIVCFPSSLTSLRLQSASLITSTFLPIEVLRPLSGLRDIILRGNYIESLPDLGYLVNLRKLDCCYNAFAELPVQQLTGLRSIEELDFRGQGPRSEGVVGEGVMLVPESVLMLSCLVSLRKLVAGPWSWCQNQELSMESKEALQVLVEAMMLCRPGLRLVVEHEGML